jgi:hypothetical protein
MSKRILFAAVVAASFALTVAARADPLPAPSTTPPLTTNTSPLSVDAGPLGKLYFGGAITGFGMYQDNRTPTTITEGTFPNSGFAAKIIGDHTWQADFTNAQAWAAKNDGFVQAFVEVGAYSFPALGATYVPAKTANEFTFGVMPVGYIKIVPSANFNIEAGKLPTLIGSEYGFTFQNMNINRGLLWSQEPLISRGVQANFTAGKVALSVSMNDGFYSSRYNWFSGLLTLTLTSADTLAFAGGTNLGSTDKSTYITPLNQNNSDILNVMYTHTKGAWTISPYFQYTHVPENYNLGILRSASTYGGALLTKYNFTPEFAVAARGEYESSTGLVGGIQPSLLYGPGSKAWSLTLTPTYQKKIFFIRGEVAYTKLEDITPGFGLGTSFDKTHQVRIAAEAGVLF